MMIPYYHVDAFTSEVFRGNPAGVCLLDAWPPDAILQSVAAENNLSETAFVVQRGGDRELRWFTPTTEVDLCGHATLAAAFVLIQEREVNDATIRFHSRSGPLAVLREGDCLTLDFPSRPATPTHDVPDELMQGLGMKPIEILKARDYLVVFQSEEDVRGLKPDFGLLKELDSLGVITTAPGVECDFVSRFFAPAAGIDEDPVTGSSHCTLTPYWSRRLAKAKLTARQISARGGELLCEQAGDRVRIGGKAVLYGRGELLLPISP